MVIIVGCCYTGGGGKGSDLELSIGDSPRGLDEAGGLEFDEGDLFMDIYALFKDIMLYVLDSYDLCMALSIIVDLNGRRTEVSRRMAIEFCCL